MWLLQSTRLISGCRWLCDDHNDDDDNDDDDDDDDGDNDYDESVGLDMDYTFPPQTSVPTYLMNMKPNALM